ncbi:MAG: hypothetical protein M1579_04245 [Gammaproteobacteria bacterium]|nr:hypothetical protein [Gammaproteobacteria bacterium]
MRHRHGIFKIFAESELSNYIAERKNHVFSSIDNEQDDYLLNVNEVDYVNFQTDKAKIEHLVIHDDRIYASSSEKMIPAEYFPSMFWVEPGRSYKKAVIKFHVPFSGNQDLIYCCPSSRIVWSMQVELGKDEFTFEIINFSNDIEKITREKDSSIQSILRQLAYVTGEVQNFNSGIEAQISKAFQSRKENLLKQHNVLASLGVPIKKTSGVSQTFSVPTPVTRKKIAMDKPIVSESGFTPEPTLETGCYFQILQMIHEVGKQFERLQSLYAGKGEEHLRDHFLMMLEPNFEGSATGETFNKTGKTDILLRHEGTNVFIAECKFWKGKRVFLDTISQLLGYLTWRDSKAAVIMFVPNVDFSSVLETAKHEVSEHPNYVEFINSKDDTWMNYRFHLNDDRNRMVSLAVMFYHTPKQSN